MTMRCAFRLVRAEGVGFEPTRSARPLTVFKTETAPGLTCGGARPPPTWARIGRPAGERVLPAVRDDHAASRDPGSPSAWSSSSGSSSSGSSLSAASIRFRAASSWPRMHLA
jgi:hypothetical protein